MKDSDEAEGLADAVEVSLHSLDGPIIVISVVPAMENSLEQLSEAITEAEPGVVSISVEASKETQPELLDEIREIASDHNVDFRLSDS